MTKRLAVIPARSGSKRVPRKNVRDFHGRPMLSYPIRAALECEIFDEIHVSTDSDEIAEIALQSGATVNFKRPANLSDDTTPILPVMKFVTEEYKNHGKEFQTITLLYATNPMISTEDLKQACISFEQGDSMKPLLAIAPFPCPIEWSFHMADNQNLMPVFSNGFATRSQDLKIAYYDAAMFCFYSSDFLLGSKGAGSDLVFRGFPVDARRVVDIDTPEQWLLAETMYKVMNAQ